MQCFTAIIRISIYRFLMVALIADNKVEDRKDAETIGRPLSWHYEHGIIEAIAGEIGSLSLYPISDNDYSVFV